MNQEVMRVLAAAKRWNADRRDRTLARDAEEDLAQAVDALGSNALGLSEAEVVALRFAHEHLRIDYERGRIATELSNETARQALAVLEKLTGNK
jgi:hypothetical protein